MAHKVKGNIKGLAPSQLKALDRLYQRRLPDDQIVSLEYARELCNVAESIGRKVGALVSREGQVHEVFVGTREILYLPDLGRYRWGPARLRRLRLVYTDLSKRSNLVQIPSDIYADLEKLRLDMVIGVRANNNQIAASYAHLVPIFKADDQGTTTDSVSDLARLDFDFNSFITELENQLSGTLGASTTINKNGAVLVGVYDKTRRDADRSMEELKRLAETAGLEILDTVIQTRRPDPKTLLGKGKLEELVLRCLRIGAEILIFDLELKPSQWRVITNSTELKVLDRSMLILDIFAQRAQSSDGRLQVELAQLKYNLPRLVEKDIGLSRLTGGIGGRGPGETKLEIGRRRSRDRIANLEKRIEKLRAQRQLRRKQRRNNQVPLVALMGYTNAGKSTLFNTLTSGKVLAEDKLFATLDPTQGRVQLYPPNPQHPKGCNVIFSDTVGFIRDLPEELVNAFRATLEELEDADYLMHVVDGSDADFVAQYEAANQVIQDLNYSDIPMLTVLNKVDLISEELATERALELGALAVSARNRIGINQLRSKILNDLFDLELSETDASSPYL